MILNKRSHCQLEEFVPDQLKSMRVFSEVVAQGNFSAAARVLGMSQSMVTKHVTALEMGLGVELLHRTTHRVIATEVGLQYVEACRRVLEDVEDANSSAASLQTEPRGVLRLTVPVSFGHRVMDPIIPEFAKKYPAISIDLELSDRRADLLGEGWDVAVRVGRPVESSLLARRLAPCRTFVCGAPEYLAARGLPVRVSELTAHSCLGYTLSDTTNAETWSFGRHADVRIDVSGPFRSNNGDTLCAMAVAGHGLIYQPSFIVADDIRAGRLSPLNFEHETVALDVYALFARAARQPAKARAFIDFLVEKWRRLPSWERDI